MSPGSGTIEPDGNMYHHFTIEGPNKIARRQNQTFDELLKRVRTETGHDAHADLYRQAQDSIAEEAPMLFVAFPAALQTSTDNLDWIQYPDGALRLQFASFK